MRDLLNNLALIQALDPDTITSDTNCTGIDRAGFESVTHIVNVGESGDTLSSSVYWDFVLQESDDDSTYTDVTDNDDVVGATVAAGGIFATIDAAAEDDTVLSIGYVGSKRYSRIQIDATGTHTNGTPMAVTGVKGHPHQAKTS